jgi:hypothetical protein
MFARIQRRTGRQIIATTHSNELLKESVGLDEVILLQPGSEGTVSNVAAVIDEIRELLEGGIGLAETLVPRTRPEHVEQLSFFGEDA